MKKLLLLLLLLVLTTLLTASEEIPTKEEVAKLYVATFNRAPDAGGLAYWTNDSGLTLSGIAKSFFVQTETKALYPEGTSNASFITSVYANLFNRQPDTAGLNYWEDELNRGVHTRDSFIQVVINGAKDDATAQDKTILDNKTTVGLSFSEAGLTNVADAKTIMAGVTDSYTTVTAALNSFGISSSRSSDLMTLNLAPTNAKGYKEAVVSTGDTFISIPSASFTMGDARYEALGTATPEHQVTVSKDFWMSKYEVTNAQFRRFVRETNYQSDLQKTAAPGCYVYNAQEKYFIPTPGRYWANAFSDTETSARDNHPVMCISYNDAIEYSKWLSKKIGMTVTLPSDAQWVLAAKGTTQQSYPWGENTPDGTRANFCDFQFSEVYPGSKQGNPTLNVDDGWADTAPIGSYPAGASPYGVLDMAGNAGEWVLDHSYSYTASVKIDPLNTGTDGLYSSRGGTWVDDYSSTEEGHTLLIENRPSDEINGGDDHNGFRIVINP